ncbi:MAG: ROK family protein [Chloroflexi bacterium]|nr:ROK family protein [Chloroflexota bacterium]
MGSSLVIGLDIGASKTLAGLVTRNGAIVRTRQVATAPSPPEILSAARSLAEQLIAMADAPVLGIGIGCAGMVDTASATVIHANDNIPGWTGTALAALDIGGLPICAENDVRAMAFGEATVGAGAAYRSLLCVTVGTGIGGAIVAEGAVWHGAHYSAGEIGYLVVDWEGDQPLILDQYCSGPAIERAYHRATGANQGPPLNEISRRAAAGDDLARMIIAEKARRFGQILAGYVTSINPEAVIVGGGVPQIGALWCDAFAAAFRASLPPLLRGTPLLPAALGVEAVLLGAAMLAWHKVDV